MPKYFILLAALLFVNRFTSAQEQQFSFGVGPALTFGFAEKTDGDPARGYSSRFSYMKTSKPGVLKGLSVDLTEVSAMDTGSLRDNNTTFRFVVRHNYGHPAIAVIGNYGREIKTRHHSFSYYGFGGPVFAFQSGGSIGATVGIAARYFLHLDKQIAIGVELSPRGYYLRMLNAPAAFETNAMFLTLPATFNFRFMLNTNKKEKPQKDIETEKQ